VRVKQGAYREVLAVPEVRTALLLAVLMRIPMFAANVALTLHVVLTLGRSYVSAGLVTTVVTVALAISNPWRGRVLDSQGLRRAMAPSLVVHAVGWSIAPFVGFVPLLVLAGVASLFTVPSFSILRQILIAHTPDHRRKAALSLDGVVTEAAFIVGPLLGVWAATTYSTSWVILVFEMLSLAAAVVLFVVNPSLRHPSSSDGPPLPRREWVNAAVGAVLLSGVATTFILSASDLGIVATLRAWNDVGSMGWVLALWGAGSLVGGLLYGAWHHTVRMPVMLAGLAATALPAAFAPNTPVFAALLFVAGVFCQPTITAIVDTLSRVVPERALGEAMGWHGSSFTTGMSIGGPVAGWAIDTKGYAAGFLVAGAVGLVGALAAARALPAGAPRPGRHGGAEATGLVT
jgi:MFS family permease